MAISYRWRLRRVMAERDLFQTTDLVEPLRSRGIQLSREQIYRLASKQPQRLSLDVLAALCDVLECTPSELIEIVVDAPVPVARSVGTVSGPNALSSIKAVRAVVRRPDR